jgi:hypothetical protein
MIHVPVAQKNSLDVNRVEVIAIQQGADGRSTIQKKQLAGGSQGVARSETPPGG